jgi:hypothetical protein
VKPCNFCMEQIPLGALVCKFCSREVNTAEEAGALTRAHMEEVVAQHDTRKRPDSGSGWWSALSSSS